MKRDWRFSQAFAVTLALVLPGVAATQDWRMQPLQIPTRWAASVSPANALPEYPRPQLVRRQWQNLNGLWEYAITAKDVQRPAEYAGGILVPYPVESALSGVQKPLQPDQLLWYRRTLDLQPGKAGQRTLLHFGAVDYEATIYLNGRKVGAHSGGYQSFTLDLTDSVKPGENELIVKVYDPTDAGPNPHGKQVLNPQGIQYTPSSGIWQTVWLESVPQTYIGSLTTTPDVDRRQLHLQVNLKGETTGYTVEAVVMSGSAIIARQAVTGAIALPIANPRLWSPDDPFLYDLEVRVLKDGRTIDEVTSYFGMRKVEVKKDAAGVERIFLNDRYTYNLGVLDQGFWPEGLYTAPTDAALRFDIEATKAMGFNTIRKHIKLEPQRWYYYCDRLGMLVWQDMPSSDNDTAEARAEFEKEIEENLAQLHNHPSIIVWGLFNEDWGAYDQQRLARWIKQMEPTRLLDGHSGPYGAEHARWARQLSAQRIGAGFDMGVWEESQSLQDNEPANWASDMSDLHHYFAPRLPPAKANKTRVLGEHGGIPIDIEGHIWMGIPGYIEGMPDPLAKTYAEMVTQLKALEAQGLSASIYTELTDIEGEQNGLVTYDRAVVKIPRARIATINSQLIPRARNCGAAMRGFVVAEAESIPQAERYAALLSAYRQGQRDPSFLRQSAFMALRQKDQAHATEAGNAFITRSAQPYSKETWAFIQAVTRTSKDKGFEILRTQMQQANAMLGDNAAEKKIREVIGREEIEPHLSDKSQTPDWAAIEKRAVARYGELGAEKVYGAQMLYHLEKQDWTSFGRYYARYFHTAFSRSEYPIDNLSYRVFERVTDPAVLEVAIEAVKRHIETSKKNPVEMDTYANLLYKAGGNREAIEWQERAVRLSTGPDKEIVERLQKMRAGQPTWPTSTGR